MLVSEQQAERFLTQMGKAVYDTSGAPCSVQISASCRLFKPLAGKRPFLTELLSFRVGKWYAVEFCDADTAEFQLTLVVRISISGA